MHFSQLDQQYPVDMKEVACSNSPEAVADRTDSICPDGTIARVGFELASSAFLSTVEQICHNESLAQTHWAKSRIVMSVRKRQREIPGTTLLQMDDFYDNVTDLTTAYSRDGQRERLLELLNSPELVDQYIPPNGKFFFLNYLLKKYILLLFYGILKLI